MSRLQAYSIMFFCGGFFYCIMEILARGRTHISMFFAGGICFLTIGSVRYLLGESSAFISQMIVCGILITLIEFCIGLIVNRTLGLNVWDYSKEQYNLLGQVCLFYSNLWFLLSAPIILLHDLLKALFLGIPLPHYRIFFLDWHNMLHETNTN